MQAKKSYPLWTELPYAGEQYPPDNPVEPLAGSWNTYFLKNDGKGRFQTLDEKPIQLEITHPSKINWRDQLKAVQSTLRNLTKEEIEIAKYWGAGPPTKQWTPIADRLIDTYQVEAPRAARILTALNGGINDALVVTWSLKYKWLVPRPNQLDQSLATVICTPRHPSYPSGHAAVSGAAEAILTYFFPAECKRLRHLAEEDAASRLYAGVHYPADNDEGLRLGRQIGRIVTEQLEQDYNSEELPVDTPYHRNLHADLLPPPFEQAIPFDYDASCSSLIIGSSKNQHNSNEHPYIPLPKLYV